MDVAEVLERAADLIEPEGKWTQDAFARTEKGFPIGPREDNAACFCLRGAIIRAGDFSTEREFPAAINRALRLSTAARAVRWNDAPGRTQSEVVAKLREAAALARSLSQPMGGDDGSL